MDGGHVHLSPAGRRYGVRVIGFAVHMSDKLSPSEHLPTKPSTLLRRAVGCNRILNELMRRQPIEIEHLRDIGAK